MEIRNFRARIKAKKSQDLGERKTHLGFEKSPESGRCFFHDHQSFPSRLVGNNVHPWATSLASPGGLKRTLDLSSLFSPLSLSLSLALSLKLYSTLQVRNCPVPLQAGVHQAQVHLQPTDHLLAEQLGQYTIYMLYINTTQKEGCLAKLGSPRYLICSHP